MNKIESIELNLPMKKEGYTVGQLVVSGGKAFNITDIKDMTIDGENIYIPIYYVYADGKHYKTIENSPVTITYFLEGTE